ncbi:MAG: MerR family transcriptional regulator [Polyangia bacterium]
MTPTPRSAIRSRSKKTGAKAAAKPTARAARRPAKRPARPAAARADKKPRAAAPRPPYRMKDLCERTGLPRQAIHFYIQQGLLPEGKKTGRNMAYYGEEHVERILLIRKLQEERFLPLRAIRAVLDEHRGDFSLAQRQLIEEVKSVVATERPALLRSSQLVPVQPLLSEAGLSPRDCELLVQTGFLSLHKAPGGAQLVPQDDAWLITVFGQLRASGFTDKLGFTPADLCLYDEAVASLFLKETALLTARLQHLPAAQVAELITRALPLINTLLVRFHEAKLKEFISAL